MNDRVRGQASENGQQSPADMAEREQNNRHQKEEDHFFWIGKCLRETVTKRWGPSPQAGFRPGRHT